MQLSVRSSIVLKPYGRFPIEIQHMNEIHAMLAQIAEPLRLIPFEFHAGTVRT